MSLRALMDTVRLGYWTAFTNSKAPARVNVENLKSGSLYYRRFTGENAVTPLVILHGLTRKGYDDRRLNHFCRVMALLGYQVFAPNLESLQNLDFSMDDVERVVQMLEKASPPGAKVGLMGFSFGAGYGLLAAADTRVADKMLFVFAADGYSSLDRVIDFTLSAACSDPYGRLCLAWVCRKDLGLTGDEMHEYEALMGDYCIREQNFSPQDRQIMGKMLEKDRQSMVEVYWREAVSRLHEIGLENNPKLVGIKASVFLMHNAQDELMPVEETLGVYRTLKNHGHQVMISISRAPGHLNYLKGDLAGPIKIFYSILNMR